MERQRVTEALVAAKLSRHIERPRVETDGRFARAIRLAKKDGSYRQKLETQYEALWTAVWWFDDLQLLNHSYDEFAAEAIGASHIRNLEFLSNLLQLLFNAVIHGGLTREESKLDTRAAELRKALQAMADDSDRPNNSLEARTSLILMELNSAIVDRDHENLSGIWKSLGDVLDQAEGLGEFPAQRVAELIEAMGDVAGNDPDYNDLIEKLAEFNAKRESEASGGLTLLKRADKLKIDDHFDIIRFAGRAATRLTKKEHTSALVRALQLLTLGYRRAGLLWVARASCAFVAASILIESEEDDRVPVSFIPTMKIWAWLSLELGHLPDALFTLQMLNGALTTLPLSDESKVKVQKDLQDIDYALGALILNASDADLEKLRAAPDLLHGLGLTTARTALLYTMGQERLLREDGSIPAEETPEGAQQMMSMLASQPVVDGSADNFIFNDGQQANCTLLLGMRIDITTDAAENSLLVAELVATSLEAFFATTAEQEIFPHIASFAISVTARADATVPSFEVDDFGTSGMLIWPAALAPHAFSNHAAVRELMLEVGAKVLAHGFITPKLEEFLNQLYSQDAVQGRMAMAMASGNSYHRINHRYFTSLAHWSEHELTTFPMGERPTLDKVDLSKLKVRNYNAAKELARKGRLRIGDHRAIEVRSVIDVHAWDQAKWKGTGYLQFAPNQPPIIALLFEGGKAARHIFSRWRERFGEVDGEHDIHVAIIREHDPNNPFHYIMQIAAKLPEEGDFEPGHSFILGSRCIENTPPDNLNLEMFLAKLAEHGCFGLMPGIVKPGMLGEPELLDELVILKRDLFVKRAADVGATEVEAMALRHVLRRMDNDSADDDRQNDDVGISKDDPAA